MGKDILVQATLHGMIRVLAVSCREMVETARNIHNLSRVCTAALGRQMMATAMMASQLKHEEESLTIIIKGDGPAGNLVSVGRYGALVKAYAHNPTVELPPTALGKLDVGGAVGREGKMTVIRDLSMKEPYVGEVPLVSGEIAEDFAHYFAVSEQINSLVYLGVRVALETGETLAAGGVIAQPLPGCPDEWIDALSARAQDIARLGERLENEKLEDIVLDIFSDMEPEIIGAQTPQWECDCSRARTERALIALGSDEMQDMIEQDGGAELSCQFCREAYQFDADALRTLMAEAGA